MANFAQKFESSTGSYSGGYTSKILAPPSQDTNIDQRTGIIQVQIVTGTVELQARLHRDAPWFSLKTWSESAMEEVILPCFMRVIVSEEAHCWLGEIR